MMDSDNAQACRHRTRIIFDNFKVISAAAFAADDTGQPRERSSRS
jgi:hypothetical protein